MIKFYSRLFSVLFILALIPSEGKAQIPTDGLIGFYLLNGNAADSSDLANDGVITGSVTATEDRDGVADAAMLFDNGYIDLGDNMAYHQLTEVSICAWVKQMTSSTSNFQSIVTKWNGFGADGLYLGINPTGNLVRWNLDVPELLEGEEIPVDIWMHVAATYDGDSARIYQNGVWMNSLAVAPADFNLNNSAKMLIGNQGDQLNSSLFFGAIDDVLIYDRALSGEEILQIAGTVTPTFEISPYANQISVFPNPITRYLNIDNQTRFSVLPYTLFNSNGAQVKSGIYSGGTIDLQSQPKGLYVLRLIVDEDVVAKKIFFK